jgi:hypothetical protein
MAHIAGAFPANSLLGHTRVIKEAIGHAQRL